MLSEAVILTCDRPVTFAAPCALYTMGFTFQGLTCMHVSVPDTKWAFAQEFVIEFAVTTDHHRLLGIHAMAQMSLLKCIHRDL